MKSYDYARRQSVHSLSWDDIVQLSGQLTEQLAQQRVDTIVGIARAGLLPATMVACSLRSELYPVRVTRRVQDEVRFSSPVWRVPVSSEVAGKVVAVIDEIADTGETLALVAEQVRASNADRVLTASLVRHSWSHPAPDFCSLVSDALILFPWDQRVLVNGKWQWHPELVQALAMQNQEPEANSG
jgi:uncharacterized protein